MAAPNTGGNHTHLGQNEYFHLTKYDRLLDMLRLNRVLFSKPSSASSLDSRLYVTRLNPFVSSFSGILSYLDLEQINVAMLLNLSGIGMEECQEKEVKKYFFTPNTSFPPITSILVGIYVLNTPLDDVMKQVTNLGFLTHFSASHLPFISCCFLDVDDRWFEVFRGTLTSRNYADVWMELLQRIGSFAQAKKKIDSKIIDHLQNLVEFTLHLPNQEMPPDQPPPASIQTYFQQQLQCVHSNEEDSNSDDGDEHKHTTIVVGLVSGRTRHTRHIYDNQSSNRMSTSCWSVSHICIRLRILLADLLTIRAVFASQSASQNGGNPDAWVASLKDTKNALRQFTEAQIVYDYRYALAVQFDQISSMFNADWCESLTNLEIQYTYWSKRRSKIQHALVLRRNHLQSLLNPQWEDRDAVKTRWGEQKWKSNTAPKQDYAKRRVKNETELRVIDQVLSELEGLEKEAIEIVEKTSAIIQRVNETK